MATWACPRQECRTLIAFKAENIPDICRHTPVSLEQDWRLCIVEPFLNLRSFVCSQSLCRTKPSQTDQSHVSGVSALELVSLHFFEHVFYTLQPAYFAAGTVSSPSLCVWFSLHRVSITRHISTYLGGQG